HVLNILAHNKNKPSITQKISTTRSLCECELYASANYDNDPQMKEVMENFNKQAQQRLREYDERLQSKRMQCKEQCDKEIEKIILKDKLEKELTEKLSTLQTDIQSDSIPTCICKKSLADKTEKFCLNCGKNMGAIAPWWVLVCGVGYAGWTPYFATTIAKMATDAGIKAGLKVGLEKVTVIAKQLWNLQGSQVPTIDLLQKITAGKFTDGVTLHGIFKCISSNMSSQLNDTYPLFSTIVDTWARNTPTQINNWNPIPVAALEKAVAKAKEGVWTQAGNVTSNLTTGIIASVVAIVIIILIMVIIYLILRRRRKKKMKKKLQYIKLLEE
ncbi:rifin, partial [Plasmodium reichenowi]